MAAPAPATPFRGLAPYREEDAMFFFGREQAQAIIRANLLAYPLTVLFGATGVGKSSVLHAGVVHHLKLEAQANLDRGRLPELAVALISSWRHDPMVAIRQAVKTELERNYSKALKADDPKDLSRALKVWAKRIGGPILVILDQFEEYFLYRAEEKGRRSFAQQFPLLAEAPDIRVNFLLAIREDALAWLDRFRPELPSLMDNSIRITHLDKASATRAIRGPIKAYNQTRPPEERVAIEARLVGALLDDVRFGRVAIGGRGQGLTGRESTSDALQGSIETPYLQLVLQRLWEEEHARGSRRLRLATLRELGGAEQIVRVHLDTSIGQLTADEQTVAAEAFQYLVTPSGSKIAHLLKDLSDYTSTERDKLLPVLDKLVDARILRTVQPVSHQGEGAYEIFHDALAPAILDWRTRFVEQAVQRQAREEAAREIREQQHKLAVSNELVASAVRQLSIDPERSVLLAVEAINARATPLALDALSRSLQASHVLAVMRGHHGDVSRAAFSPDGRRVVTVGQDATVRMWRVPSGRRLAVLSGHTDWVWSAAFNRAGDRLVTASTDGTARLWDARTGKPLAVLSGHGDTVWGAVFDDAGTRILTASEDGTARLWHGRTGALLHVLPDPHGTVRSAAFTPDGSKVVTGGSAAEVRVWDVAGGRELAVLEWDVEGAKVPAARPGQTRRIWNVAVSPDGALIAATGGDWTARIWRLADPTGPLTLEGHTNQVWSAEFSPDSTLVVTASFDETARVWDAETGTSRTELRGTHSVYSASFSPDGQWVLTASLDNVARIHDVATGRTVKRLIGHTRGISFAKFSADGRHVVTTSQDRTARIWDAASGQTSLELRGHLRAVAGVAFSPDSRRLVTAGGDDEARIWDVEDGSTILHLPAHGREVSAAVFSPDGDRIATGSWDRTARICDAHSGRMLRELKGHGREVTSVAISPDGATLATGSFDQTARLWSVATGELLHELRGHDGPVESVAFSPDGALVATASHDLTAGLWEVTTGRLRAQLRGHRQPLCTVCFHPDGRRLVTAGEDRTARIWDVAAATSRWQLKGHTGKVYGAAFNRDGTQVITASEDQTAALWDWKAERQWAELRDHAGGVNTAAFSADGQLIATGGDDGTARIYRQPSRPTTDALLQAAAAQVTRKLTPDERTKYLQETPAELLARPRARWMEAR